MVKKSSQKDKQPHIKTRKKKTLKRKSSRKELKRTKKRKHDEEGGGIFDVFRTVKISGTSKDDQPLEFNDVFSSDEADNKDAFNQLMLGLNNVEISPGNPFTKVTFWNHFSRIYGLSDDWNSLVAKSRLRYLLEFKFFREFMGDGFDYKGIISSENVSTGLSKMKGYIGTFFQEHLNVEQMRLLLDKNYRLKRGINGIFGWTGSFGSQTENTRQIWDVNVADIKKAKGNNQDIAELLIDDNKTSRHSNDDGYQRFKKFTLLLIFVYHYYFVVREQTQSGQKIASDNTKKTKSSASGKEKEQKEQGQKESDIVVLTTGMERLLNTGVFKTELLGNNNMRIFFMSYIETQRIRTGIWINALRKDENQTINLYLLTNNIKNFRFLDCLYTDEYQIDALTWKGGYNLDSNKFVAGHDCPTEIFPKVGTILDYNYFQKKESQQDLDLRGISFYPMRCPNRGFKQLVSECRQFAFVNHIVSRDLNTIMTLPYNMREYSLIIQDMFKSPENLTLEKINKYGYTKIKLIDLPKMEVNSGSIKNLEQIYVSLFKALNDEFENLRVTVNNGPESVGDEWETRIEGVESTSPTEGKEYMEIKEGSKRFQALREMYQYFTKENTDANPKATPIDNLHTSVPLGGNNPPMGYDDTGDVWERYIGETPDFESQLIAYCTNATNRTWMSWAWGGATPEDKARPYVKTLLSLIHMKDYDEKLFDKPNNVSKLKTLGHKLSEISQKYFLPYSTDQIEKESYTRDMDKLKDLFLNTLGKYSSGLWEFDPTEITFNFKTPESPSRNIERFLTIKQLKKDVIKDFINPNQNVKVGIVFKETGETSGTQKKYYRQKSTFPTPIPTENNELFNTFTITPENKFIFNTDFINGNIFLSEVFQDGDQKNILKGRLQEKLLSLFNKDNFVKSEKFQMFMFLFEDNKVTKITPVVNGISQKPQMSFWFKEES